jgi:hypothetical protein
VPRRRPQDRLNLSSHEKVDGMISTALHPAQFLREHPRRQVHLNDGFGARLCENTQGPTRRRIVFSIALFQIAAAAQFLFRLTKSRRIFYA